MPMKGKNRIFSVLNRIEEIILVAMFAVMVLVIFVQVIMRKANNSLVWSEELGKFLFVWISWLGISIGQRKGEHIKITMLVDRFPFRVAQIFNILSDIIVIVICAVTLYYGVTLVITQRTTPYAGIKISTSWGYLAVVVGCALMILRCLVSSKQSLVLLIKGKPEEPAEEPEEEPIQEEAPAAPAKVPIDLSKLPELPVRESIERYRHQ